MKILHIVATSNYSAVARVVENIAANADHSFVHYYVAPNGKVFDVLDKAIVQVPVNTMTLSAVKRAIDEVKPDFIHSHDMKATVFGVMSKLLLRSNSKILSHLHSTDPKMKKWTERSVTFRILWPFIEKMIIVTPAIYTESVLNKFVDKSEFITLLNVVNEQEIEKYRHESDCKKYDIGISARLTHPKNPERMLHVIAEVKKRIPDIKVIWLGDGELETKVKRLTAT